MNTRHGQMNAKTDKRRVFQGQIRATDVNGAPGVTLKIVRYNVVDDWGSVWTPGCLLDGLNERLPQMVRQHDRSVVIGRAVKDFSDDGDGQIVAFRFANLDRVEAANEAHSLVEDGILDECSIGFRWEYEFHTPDTEDLKRWPGATEIITKAFVSEVSLVMEGAVPGAKVLSFREKPLRVLTLSKREPQMISEEDAARIINATIEKMQSGAVGTDVLIASLQDIQSLVVTDVDGGDGDEAAQTSTETQASETAETETTETEQLSETQEQSDTATAETDTGNGETGETQSEDAEVIDEEIQELLAEVDELLTDRDDIWIPEAPSL